MDWNSLRMAGLALALAEAERDLGRDLQGASGAGI